MSTLLASGCGDQWTNWGAWTRALTVALSTVCLNTWLAHRIARRPERPLSPDERRYPEGGNRDRKADL